MRFWNRSSEPTPNPLPKREEAGAASSAPTFPSRFGTVGVGLGLFYLAMAPAAAAPRATVTVYPTATVAATDVTLGDIAVIKCSDKAFSARLMSAVIGRAPMPGMTRPLTGGDVRLKLRQDGIDPETVALAGSDTVIVAATASASANLGVTAPSATSKSGDILIRTGDSVNLVYECDGVVITARVVAMTPGAAGDQITAHRDGADRALRGTVIDSQTVRLEE